MKRRAFTLVELLMVVAIIGILIGLLLPAVNAVRVRTKRAAISMELSQFDIAIKAFKEKCGDYPPDFGNLDRREALMEVRRFIARAWPRCSKLPSDWAVDPDPDKEKIKELPAKYNPATALVIWLGGVRDSVGELQGFSADPQNPFDVDANGAQVPDTQICTSRIPRFYELKESQTTVYPGTTDRWCYWPAQLDKNQRQGEAGIVYFKAGSKGYTGRGWGYASRPAMTDGTATTPNAWLQPKSFQLRCCGLDGKLYDIAVGVPTWWATYGKSVGDFRFSADDQLNCVDGMLADNY